MLNVSHREQMLILEAKAQRICDEAKEIYVPVMNSLIKHGSDEELTSAARFYEQLFVTKLDARFLYEEIWDRSDRKDL
jgi:hypothetical protein